MSIKRVVFSYKNKLFASATYTESFRQVAEEFIGNSGGRLQFKELVAEEDFKVKYPRTKYIDSISLFLIGPN